MHTEESIMDNFLEPTSLSDTQMRSFLTEGCLILKTGVPNEIHGHIRERCEEIFSTVGNPGNEILELNPALRLILADPAVRGALQSILGPDFFPAPPSTLPPECVRHSSPSTITKIPMRRM